jgi:hypothetical protein
LKKEQGKIAAPTTTGKNRCQKFYESAAMRGV